MGRSVGGARPSRVFSRFRCFFRRFLFTRKGVFSFAGKGGSVTEQDKTALCVGLLISKAKELKEAGQDRYPRRSDFTEQEASEIKNALGPWPRALEKAGLKPPPEVSSADKNRERRIRAKRKRNEKRREK